MRFRVHSQVKLYDGRTKDAVVYVRKDNTPGPNDKPPTQRYIEIMVEGCKHFGIKQSYIDWLEGLESQPRTKPEDWKKFDVPTGMFLRMHTNG